jgi:hypothetical protein
MRSILVLAILTASSPALAERLDGIDPETVPSQCRAFVDVPADAAPHQSARISLANCLANARFSSIKTRDASQMVGALDDAARQSFALLDEVVRDGDPHSAIIAEHARGALFVAMATRVRAAIPAVDEHAPSVTELTHRNIEVAIAPWLARADAAFAEVARVGDAHPELANDHVIRNLERISRAERRARATGA